MKTAICRQAALISCLLILASAALAAAPVSAPAPSPSIQLRLESPLVAGQPNALIATMTVPPGLHLVRQADFLRVGFRDPVDGVSAMPLAYPAATGRVADTDIYTGTVELRLPLVVSAQATPGKAVWNIEVGWQICYDDGICLRPASRVLELPVDLGGNTQTGALAILAWFGLAFLGGLFLNIMPCVLPVLSLKALSLVGHQGDRRRQRREGWAMIAGILSSLLILALILLALKAGGAAVGWGFQFQSPWYTLGLALVVFTLGLSLFEIWHLPAFSMRSSGVSVSGNKGIWASFSSGLLTVLLATPCTAPFLGAALGFALTASPAILLLVFLGVGLGLALPFGVVVFFPGGGLRFPKPGRWLDRFRELMAFALLATVVWLLTVLAQQLDAGRFAAVLWLMLALGILLRLTGWLQESNLAGWRRRLVLAGLLMLMAVSFWMLAIQPALAKPALPGAEASATKQARPAADGDWLAFDEESVRQAQAAGQGVFIDFTASWCLSCKINEAGALADPAVLAAFRTAGIRLYRGDYTNPDPVITRWLERYQRAGVPFYLLLRPGKEPRVLPELLTAGIILDSLR